MEGGTFTGGCCQADAQAFTCRRLPTSVCFSVPEAPASLVQMGKKEDIKESKLHINSFNIQKNLFVFWLAGGVLLPPSALPLASGPSFPGP